MKRKHLALILSLTVSISVLGGCVDSNTNEDTAQTEETAFQSEEGQEEDRTYGEILEVGEDSVTIEIGVLREMNQETFPEDDTGEEIGEAVQTAKDAGDSQTAEEEESLQATSETVSEEQDAQKASEDGDESRETDDTASVEDGDEVPDAPEGEEREMPSMLDLTGDELVVSITEETQITRQIMSGDQGGPQMGEAPEKPESQDTGEKPESQDTGEEAAGQDSTEEGQQPPDGEGPEEPDGQNAEDGKQQEELTLEDLAEGDTVSILLNEDGSAAEIAVMGGGAGGGTGGQTEAPDSYEAVDSYTEDAQETDKTVSSEGTDENAVLVSEGAEVSFSDLVVSRMSEDSEGGDAASFYGVGAALLNIDGSLYLTDSTINTEAAPWWWTAAVMYRME